MVQVYGTGTSPRASGDCGSGEQAGPGVEGAWQLHAAAVVARKRAVTSPSSLPDTLDGLCTGHLSGSLITPRTHRKQTCKYRMSISYIQYLKVVSYTQ